MTIENLPVYNDKGDKISYFVMQEPLEDYFPGYEVNDPTNPTIFKITNYRDSLFRYILVNKQWIYGENQHENYPESVEVQLLANGIPVQSVLLEEKNDWGGLFFAPLYNDKGDQIRYTVKETEVEGYTSNITGDIDNGFTITNTSNTNTDTGSSDTIDVTVTKVWEDGDNLAQRPSSVEITLYYANGNEVKGQEPLVLDAAGNWEGVFSNLPKYDDDGREIFYYVWETAVMMNGDSEYHCLPDVNSESYPHFVITNYDMTLHSMFSFEIVWEDEDNRYGLRPDKVTVELVAKVDNNENEKVVETFDVTGEKYEDEGGEFEYWFGFSKIHPLYDKDGNEITYRFRLKSNVPGYNTDIEDENGDGMHFIITNTPAATSVSVNKEWDDDDDRDGKRPENVTVQLYADGKPVDGKTLVLNEENKWSGSFADLSVYAEEDEIAYTVAEIEEIDGYECEISGDAAKGFTITNTYEPEKVNIDVTKAWDDNDNEAEKRPKEVVVHLYANGEDTGLELKLSKEDKWKGSFEDVYKYEDGKEIKYTLKEDKVPYYKAKLSGDSEEGFTLTNKYYKPIITEGPKTGDINGIYIWSGMVLLTAAAGLTLYIVKKKKNNEA